MMRFVTFPFDIPTLKGDTAVYKGATKEDPLYKFIFEEKFDEYWKQILQKYKLKEGFISMELKNLLSRMW